MSLTVTQMRTLVRRGLGGLDVTDLPDADCDLYLNLALSELGAKFRFEEKEEIWTSETIADVYEYLLAGITNLDALQSVALVTDDGDGSKLVRMSREQLDNWFSTTETGQPKYFLREGNVLTLWPIPDAVYTIRVATLLNIDELLGASDTSGLPPNWDELIVEGAIQRGHIYNEDYILAQQLGNITIGKVRQAVETQSKEEQDSGSAGLDVMWEAPPEE